MSVTQYIDEYTAESIRSLIDEAARIVLLCHMTPDGDALGSMLFMRSVLAARGKRVCMISPDMPPASLMFLHGARDVLVASAQEGRAVRTIAGADLIICLDFNDSKRIDRMAHIFDTSAARRILIDHHLHPVIKSDVMVSHPGKSSTCALAFLVVEALGWLGCMDADAALCCCAGMMTDTGNFSYNSNDPDLYRILSILVATGIDKDALCDRLFNTNSESRVRLMGYGQYRAMELFPDHGAALITLSASELEELHYHTGDTEGLVNVPLSIPGIYYSIYLREDRPDYVKVSMRSRGAFSVKDLCRDHFGGGGHINAAGGESHTSLALTRTKVLDIIATTPSHYPG